MCHSQGLLWQIICQIISVLWILGKQVLAHKISYAGQASFGWGRGIYLTVAAVDQISMLRAHTFQQPHRMVLLINLAVSSEETDEADLLGASFFCISPHFVKVTKAWIVEMLCWLYSIYGLYDWWTDGFCTICFHGYNNVKFPILSIYSICIFFFIFFFLLHTVIFQEGNCSPTSY